MKIPADTENYIFAVEIVDNLTFGEKMTDELETAYPTFSKEIFEAIHKLIFSGQKTQNT